jgi:hypothetical protein
MAQAFIQPSIADIHESKLVERLMRSICGREDLTGISGISENVEHFLEVPLDGCPGGHPRGDIDILLFERTIPEYATAIQVKRVKVSHNSFETSLPNKLAEIEKGVRQTNLLCTLGFAQVYFYVFVVVDSRTQNTEEYGYKGLTEELHATIDATLSSLRLNERAGLIKYTFIQPMDYPPLGVGAGDATMIRKATLTPQPTNLTEWLRNLP